MKWQRKSKFAEQSDTAMYSVCAIAFGSPGGGFFEAWRTRRHPEGPHLIATNLKTASEARKLCIEDACSEH